MNWTEAMDLTADSLSGWGDKYRHWAVAYSGGKDSTATLAAVVYLIESGRVKKPESLTVMYADTRMELPPLHAAAMVTLAKLRERGYNALHILPPMDRRFYVYMFGRGVPPPGAHFRWCTGGIKIEPMQEAIRSIREETGEKLLVITGVRLGESAARDARIVLSCGKNGAECGQGWFQETTPAEVADTLAPILHWRVCFVWDWLYFHAPAYTGLPTQLVAEAYGAGSGDLAEAIEKNLRTGCVGCPVASRDVALETAVAMHAWSFLRPLLELRDLYEDLRLPKWRIRKDGSERAANGALVRNPCRMGPLTFEGRRYGLERVLEIQARVNATRGDKPAISLIDEEEHTRILELISAKTWPDKWTGDEPRADLPYEKVNPDGSSQPLLAGILS